MRAPVFAGPPEIAVQERCDAAPAEGILAAVELLGDPQGRRRGASGGGR